MKIHINLLLFLTPFFLFGQPAGGNDPALSDEAGIGERVKDAEQKAQSLLRGLGIKNGWSESKKLFAAVGTSAIPISPGKGYCQARKDTYEIAILNCKKEIAGFMSAKISTNITYTASEASDDEVEEELNEKKVNANGIVDKVELLAHAHLDDLLRAKGIPKNTEEAKKVIKREIMSESFQKTIKSACRAETAGMITIACFEDQVGNNGRIAVVGLISEKTRKLAGAVLGKNPAPVNKSKKPIDDYIYGDEFPTEVLISTHGVKTRPDENGNLVLLAFGQSSPKTSSGKSLDFAYKKAHLSAQGFLRQFAGELVAGESGLVNSSTYKEYEDESKSWESDEDLSETIDTFADTLEMPGIYSVRKWKSTDSRSGEIVAGQVLAWEIGSAMGANVIRDQFSELRGSAGGQGTSNLRPKPSSTSNSYNKPSIKKSSSSSRVGAVSDLDDF
jgi:hypothetical protein